MSDIQNDDFFAPELQDDGNQNTAAIKRAFAELMDAEQKVSLLAAQLEGEAAVVSKLKSETLPDLLKDMGTEIWRDPDTGIAIELETAVNSKLPKDQDKRNEVLDKLRPIGIEQIMAEEFNVTFTPNDRRAAMIRAILGLEPQEVVEGDDDAPRLTNHQHELIANLRKELELGELPADEKLGVHPSRLKAWLKDMIDKGHGITITEAGIWHGKHAKVVRPKGGK